MLSCLLLDKVLFAFHMSGWLMVCVSDLRMAEGLRFSSQDGCWFAFQISGWLMRVRSTVNVGRMEVGGACLMGKSQWEGEQGRDSTSCEIWRGLADKEGGLYRSQKE